LDVLGSWNDGGENKISIGLSNSVIGLAGMKWAAKAAAWFRMIIGAALI
jgi:hypothetical protein